MDVAARTTAEIDVSQRRSGISAATWEQLGIIVSGLVLALAILGVLHAFILGFTWFNRPFFGALTSPTLVVNGTRPLGDVQWQGLGNGLKPNDRITKINDVSFVGNSDPGTALTEFLSQSRIGQEIQVEVSRSGSALVRQPGCSNYTATGMTCTYKYLLLRMPLFDFIAQFGIGALVAIALLVIGGALWILRRHQNAARLVAVMCAALAYIVVSRFELVTTFQTTILFVLAACVLAGGLFQTALVFPYELASVRRRSWLRVLPFVVAFGGFAAGLATYQQGDARTYDMPQLIGTSLTVFTCAVMLVSMASRRRHAASPSLRDQAGITLIGATVTLAPTALWLLTVLLERAGQNWWNVDLSGLTFSSVFVLPPLLILPLAIAYTLFQRRLIDSDHIVSEGIIYSALGIMLIIGYLLVSGAVYILTWGVIQPNNPLLIAVTLFVISLAFTPMRLRLERAVDRAFFKQARIYDRRLEQFARSLTTAVDVNEVVNKLTRELDDTVAPRYVFIFLRNLSSGEYECYPDPVTGKPATDIHFAGDSPLVQTLRTQMTVLYLDPTQPLPTELFNERGRLTVLNTPLIARLQSTDRLNGFIALGPRQDRSPYRYDEFRFVEGLADQAAAAFERSQTIIEAQRSARELRVLSQVSSALNIPMDFDTLLEFVYTQTDKVINAPNFYIALREKKGDELYFAFYQEVGERIPEMEEYRWPLGRDVMSEIVRSGQPFKTENYVQEMLRRDSRALVHNDNLHAWMGVPLNAGTGGALGCLALGTTDSVVTYTEDQLRIFWAIADMAATAIYKTRLLEDAEERARQMKVLNDTSSRLASEFEDLDALLRLILESSVELLRAEAGGLLLRDDATGDLIFQLAIGGAGQHLVGTRIPAGSGIAGEVVQTGRHVIVNDAHQDRRWFGEVSKESDGKESNVEFHTRSILAVPLTARGGVIGVLEIINKKDGTPFVEEDVNLLTAFGGQAAVAFENTRLFQMTDQALAARLQQLDTMQRIDQELNRTLDFQRVVDLTIDNAVRESFADAGALALVHPDPLSFQIVGSIGYPEEVLPVGEFYPITYGILGRVYRTGQAALITAMEMEMEHQAAQTLPGARNQLAVPLITGDSVTAVLLLESVERDAFNMLTASFIQGLAEHANTAITNSRLFAQLQEANQARSKFVGFVAHELKNPMTSIKGYAEVLLGGMTGQLNDQQQSFIAVIQSNAVRLQQLVTDLNDITAQETGNLVLKKGAVSFNNVILETLRPQQRAIDEKGQKVVMNVPDNLPLVHGDELRIIQILTNFVSNAHKYTPPGGTITILAEVSDNHWDPHGAPKVIHCAISDTGIGMSEEDLNQKLFKPYWRSEDKRAREQPGTGLGMTLTRGLIEAHDGKIWVESTLNVGTTFHFTVPLVRDSASMAR